MSRAERGWDGPEMFRCALCRAKGHAVDGITHRRIPLLELTFQTPEAARETAEQLENAGRSLTLRGHIVDLRNHQCTAQIEHIERNPYLNEDGSEKYVLSRWQEFVLGFVMYASTAFVLNLMFSRVFPATYGLDATREQIIAWFADVLGR